MRTALPSPIAAETLARLGARITAHAGLELPGWVLASRLRERAQAQGLDSLEAYVDLVTSGRGGGELDRLLEVLRVGETSFFRHAGHIKALIDVVVPELRMRPSTTLRTWSAGCASGEEAYTLAMILQSSLPPPRYRVSVLGTDLSHRALAVAAQARYPDSALARVPEPWRSQAFVGSAGTGWVTVAPSVARCVRFEHHNLVDGRYPRGFDIIFCRNVLIYFAAEARAHAVHFLTRSLVSGGFLVLGYAESLREVPELQAVRTDDAVIYRKLSQPGQHTPPLALPGARMRERPSSMPPSLPGTPSTPPARPLAPALATPPPPGQRVVRLHGDYTDGARLMTELTTAMEGASGLVVVVVDGAEYLGDEAAQALRRAQSAARATGVELVLQAERTGPVRWLRRHRLTQSNEPAK